MVIRDNRKIVSQLMKFALGLTYRRNIFFNLLCVTLIFFFTFLFCFSLSQSFFSWCIPWGEISNSSENFWLFGDFCTIKLTILLKIARNSLESVRFAKIIHQNFERNVITVGFNFSGIRFRLGLISFMWDKHCFKFRSILCQELVYLKCVSSLKFIFNNKNVARSELL